MITEDTIMYLKEKYNGHKIIYVRFSNEEFIFRTLSKKEYKYIKSISETEYDLHDNICNAGCLYPEDFDFNYSYFAGMADYLADIIEKESGFTDIDKIMECYYNAKNNVTLEEQCMDMIKAFIPEYTYEEMKDWTWQQLMETTARAERIAKLKGFDYHLNDKTKDMEEEYDKMNSNNPEFIKNLYQHGIDPMFHFKSELKLENDIIDFPLIIGTSYDNEVILDAVRQQIAKKKISK